MPCAKMLLVLESILFVCCMGLLQTFLPYDEGEISLSSCAYALIDRFTANHLRLCSCSHPTSRSEDCGFSPSDDLLISHIHEQNRWAVTIHNINWNSFYFSSDERATRFIILMKSPNGINLVLKNLIMENRESKFLIIFQRPLENSTKVIAEIKRFLFSKANINVEIVATDFTKVMQHTVYSWKQHCGKPRRKITENCSFGVIYNKSVIISNKRKTKGCFLKAVCPYILPYSNCKRNGHEIKGIEETLFDTVAQTLHLTVIYRSIKFNEKGSVYPNGTATGDFRLLQNGLADIIFGTQTVEEVILKYFRSTTYYMMEEMSWCAPFKPIFGYDKFFRSINIQFLIYTTIAYFVTSFATWYISNLEKRESSSYVSIFGSFLNTFSVLVGVSVHKLPNTGKMRFLLSLFASTTLILNIFNSSHITGLLVSANYKVRYDNLDDIYEDGLTTYGPFIMKNFLQGLKSDWIFDIDADEIASKLEICHSGTRCLENVVENNSATFLSKLSRAYLFKYFEIPDMAFIHCSEQHIYKLFPTAYVVKDFSFLEEINRVIGRVVSSGLIIKWKKDVGTDIKHNTPDHMIKLKHVLPVFKLYLWVNGLVLLVFLAELIIGRRTQNMD